MLLLALRVAVPAVTPCTMTCLTLGSYGALKTIRKMLKKKAKVEFSPSTATYRNIKFSTCKQLALHHTSCCFASDCKNPLSTQGLTPGPVEVEQSGFAVAVKPTFLPSWSIMRTASTPECRWPKAPTRHKWSHAAGLAGCAMLQTSSSSCQVPDGH